MGIPRIFGKCLGKIWIPVIVHKPVIKARWTYDDLKIERKLKPLYSNELMIQLATKKSQLDTLDFDSVQNQLFNALLTDRRFVDQLTLERMPSQWRHHLFYRIKKETSTVTAYGKSGYHDVKIDSTFLQMLVINSRTKEIDYYGSVKHKVFWNVPTKKQVKKEFLYLINK